MKKTCMKLLPVLLALWLVTGTTVLAQTEDEELRLRLNKVIGYSSLGGKEFQGVMKLEARGPETLQRVVFYLDGQPMGEVTQAPFELRFNTGDYALGNHMLTAVGLTSDGRELLSNQIRPEFVTAERGWQAGLKMVTPMLVIIFGVMLVSFLLLFLTNRGKNTEIAPGTPRKYGLAGGTICPRCSRPFPMHITGINISPVHRLDRCPYCGKWGAMRRRSMEQLRAAEAAELKMARAQGLTPVLSEEEKLRKELENSRYL